MANGNSRKKKQRIWWIGTTVVVLLVLGTVVTRATSSSTKIDPTKIANVDQGDLAKSVVATGKVQPITKVEVKSKASGIVKKLLVDAGDRVRHHVDRMPAPDQLGPLRQRLALGAAGDGVEMAQDVADANWRGIEHRPRPPARPAGS